MGWIAVIRLENFEFAPCMSLYNKVNFVTKEKKDEEKQYLKEPVCQRSAVAPLVER